MPMKHTVYRFSGLNILSDTPLPELELRTTEFCDSDEQVLVRLAASAIKTALPQACWFLNQILDDGRLWMARAKNQEGYLLRYNDLADFWVDRLGGQVTCCARTANVSDSTIRALLLDHVLPLVSALRGKYALHAAAVVTERGACAFSGGAGIGKSTLAASLSLAGYRLLTDDCLILEGAHRIVAAPAHPGIKLYGDSLEILMPQAKVAKPVAEYSTKRRLSLAESGAEFPTEPAPLARIYFLVRRNEVAAGTGWALPRIERLSPRDAFVELVNEGIRLDNTDQEMLIREFQFTERLAMSVPIKRLVIPDDLQSLEAVRKVIVADLEQN
jgi:hypothetical protein